MSEIYFYQVGEGKIHRDTDNLNGVVLKAGGRVSVCPSCGTFEDGSAQIRASLFVTDRGGIPVVVDLTPIEATAIIKRLQRALQVAHRRAQDFREKES